MRSADHPNARWLATVYLGAAEIKRNTAGSSPDEVEEQMRAHVARVAARFSEGFVLHTGGRLLAATGGRDFMNLYMARRATLSGGSFRTVELHEIVADESYGLVTGRFQGRRGDDAIDMVGMGAWRFVDGLAVEHWEMPHCDQWDDFFLRADPDFPGGTAEEFWRR